MSDLIVNVDDGQLRGKVAKDLYGKDYYSFQGIPYAKPPLGELRFRSPQPPEPWAGIRDATNEPKPCYSRHLFDRKIISGSEDCLYLNVFTPNLPEQNSSPVLKPVMFFIHGGGFIYGSSSPKLFGAENLMTEDIVLVTLNYRLGILGFLKLNDTSLNVPGNAAFKDIIMALKWVQNNIEQFSGNPHNVTVFGSSSGAAMVHYLVLSPMTKGLFHKAIAQSGCALNPCSRARDITSDLAKVLGIEPVNEAKILKALRSLTVEEILEMSRKINDPILNEEVLVVHTQRAYVPVVEKPSNEEAFLSENPIDIIISGKFNKVPFMTGYTNNEGLLLKVFIKPIEVKMSNDFELAIPYYWNLKRGSHLSKLIAKKIEQFYFDKNMSDQERLEKYFLLQGDGYFVKDVVKTAKLHAARSPNPVYLYRVSIESDLNFYKGLVKCKDKGVCHIDEIGYLFKTVSTPKIKPGSIEEIYIKRFVRLWTNFARYGDPTPKIKDPLINLTWKPITKNELNFIDIGNELTVGVNPDGDRMAFWEELEEIVEQQPRSKF